MIYLDSAATSFHRPPEVEQAVLHAMHFFGNPGRGAHAPTLDAARTVYDTRVRLAELFGAEDPARIAFSCNATEALNTAIFGLFHPGDHVITTVCEHNSVLRPLYLLESQGVEVTRVGTIKEQDEASKKDDVSEQDEASKTAEVSNQDEASEKDDVKGVSGIVRTGRLDYEMLEQSLQKNTKAIVLAHASNLTGNVADILRIGKFARENRLLFVVDASQSAGILPIDVQKQNIDVLCFTGHKGLMGPQGTGGIYVREGVSIAPLKSGGSGIKSYEQEHPKEMPTSLEAGTLNAHGIAGLNAAAAFIQKTGIQNIHRREMTLANRFLDGLMRIPNVKLYGDLAAKERVPIVTFNIGDYDSSTVSDWLWEDYGICVRAGAHCAPLMHLALGTKRQGAVRVSFSYFNTEDEIDTAIEAVRELAK